MSHSTLDVTLIVKTRYSDKPLYICLEYRATWDKDLDIFRQTSQKDIQVSLQQVCNDTLSPSS